MQFCDHTLSMISIRTEHTDSNRGLETEICEALGKLTWIIENHSAAAWPLFDRLEKELETLRGRKSRLDRYLSLIHI